MVSRRMEARAGGVRVRGLAVGVGLACCLVAAGAVEMIVPAGGTVSAYGRTLAAERSASVLVAAEGAFSHESAAVNAGRGAHAAELAFVSALAGVSAEAPAGAALAELAMSRNTRYLVRPSAAAAAAVLGPLAAAAARSTSAAGSSGSDARGGAGGGLALGAGLLGAALAVILLVAAWSTRSLGRAIRRLQSGAVQLSRTVDELRLATKEAATATAQQSTAVVETSVTIEQLAAAASSIAENAQRGSESVRQTNEQMLDLQDAVDTIEHGTVELASHSQRIGEIVELISDFALQTNQLALSAAIEAARAGRSGKGFSVVAAEVRKLAERSAESAQSIREIVAGIRAETDATITATGAGSGRTREVHALMEQTSALLEASIAATGEQSVAAGQVAASMAGIREATWQLTADQERSRATTERVEEIVVELDEVIGGLGLPVRAAAA